MQRKDTLVVALWIFSVWICDTQSAVFLSEGHGLLQLLFFTNAVGAVSGYTALICTGDATCTLRVGGLHVVLAVCNSLALCLMFGGFVASGMSSAYALKTTEPLFTALASTDAVLRLLQWFDSSHTQFGISHTLSLSVWLSVLAVCSGAAISTTSLPTVGLLQWSVTSALVLCSNAAFAVRTTVQKALLSSQRHCGTLRFSVFMFSCLLFVARLVPYYLVFPLF